MKIATVAATVTLKVCVPALEERPLLLCKYSGSDGLEDYAIAIDGIGVSIGDRVLVLDEGDSARQIMGLEDPAAVRSVVVGTIDHSD